MSVDLSGLTYHVHELVEGELGLYMGGANDAAQAVAVANAVYVVAAIQGRVIVVVDDTGTIVSFIGRNPQQADL